jgi:hypothetical protein
LTPKTNIFDNVTFDTKEGVEEKMGGFKIVLLPSCGKEESV